VFRGVTPKLGVNVRLSPAHSLFASVGGGIEAPAGNETDPASTFGQDTITGINPLLDPIRSTTVEIGTRQLLVRDPAAFVRELTYDVALYQTAVRNEIVPYRGGRFYFTAGRVRRRGAELGVRVAAAGGLSLQGALALTDHRYRDYVVDSVHYGQPGSFANYSGNRVVGVPRATYTLGAGVTPRPIAPVTLRVTYQGTSAYFADDANQIRVAGYGLTHVTLGIDEPIALGGGVGLRGFVTINNLFDRAHLASAYLNPDVVSGVPVAFEPGLPRSVLVSVSLSAAPATR
jgi:iron complex outermembrane recepter protein